MVNQQKCYRHSCCCTKNHLCTRELQILLANISGWDWDIKNLKGDQQQPLQHWAKKLAIFGPLTRKLETRVLSHLKLIFWKTIFWPVRGAACSNFYMCYRMTKACQPPKSSFQSDLRCRAASSLALPHISSWILPYYLAVPSSNIVLQTVHLSVPCFQCFLPARRYASAGYSDRNVSVRLSVCLSVRHAPVLCQNKKS